MQYSLDAWEEQEAFWTLWYLFISYVHCSGSKAVARPALNQSETKHRITVSHKHVGVPKINFQTQRGPVKIHGPGWFLLLITCHYLLLVTYRVNLSQSLLKACAP